jgi:hypothetical protein
MVEIIKKYGGNNKEINGYWGLKGTVGHLLKHPALQNLMEE